MSILQSKYYSSSDHTYHYIDTFGGVMVVKMDSDDQVIWHKHHSASGMIHTFDVAPDESTFVYFEDTSTINAYKFNGTNGMFIAAYRQSSMGPDVNNSTHISYSDDSSSLWFIARTGSSNLYLCSWDLNTNMM